MAGPTSPSSTSTTCSPNATLARLSFAPTTQTTVVTTTTTTTTSFPPFLLNAPSLRGGDFEQYPLAAAPTPSAIKKICFDLDGQSAILEEADNAGEALKEFSAKLQTLTANGGTIQSILTSDGPQSALGSVQGSSTQGGSGKTASVALGKRPSTPTSMLESSERANTNFSRQHKRQRVASSTHESDKPHHIASQRRSSLAGLRPIDGRPGSRESGNESASSRTLTIPQQARSSGSGLRELHDGQVSERWPTNARLIAGSVTPPDLDSDLDGPQSLLAGNDASVRPTMLSTSPDQGGNLPSPSLSPITAAASLAPRITEAETERKFSVSMLPPESRPFQPETADTSEHLAPESLVSIADVPTIVAYFDSMPENLKTYMIYQFLRRCSKPTLHFVSQAVGPALRCDFLSRLPLELSLEIVKYLDFQSMCRAAQVSKKWRTIIDTDEAAWKDLLDMDGFHLPKGEIERAVQQGWGWHLATELVDRNSSGNDALESYILDGAPDESMSSVNADSETDSDDCTENFEMNRKRKLSSLGSGSKRQKTQASDEWGDSAQIQSFNTNEMRQPNAYTFAARAAKTTSSRGLPSLRNMHLFKSIYQRHHQLRQRWMNPDAKPHHLAFRAQQRHVVTCLQFDGDKILTGSDDSNIDIYDTKTGMYVKRLEGHEGGVWALEYLDNTLVSGSTDRSVRIWDIENGRCMHVFQGHTSTVRCLKIVRPVKTGERADGSPIFTPEQPLIITGSRDATCRVWKLPKPGDEPCVQSTSSMNDNENRYFIRALTGHAHSVRAIAAHGDILVSGSYDATVRVWKIPNGELVHRLQGHSAKVYSVVLDHARARCISGSMDNYVKVWSLESGACLFNLEGHTSLVGLLDLKDDWLVSAAADSTLRIWNPETGVNERILAAHTGAITCFAHDGQKVISGSDRTLKMWNTRTGELVRDLLTDLGGVWQVEFDDRRCVAAVQRNEWTYIEVLDFGACSDNSSNSHCGRRIVVDEHGREIEDPEIASLPDVLEAPDQDDADA